MAPDKYTRQRGLLAQDLVVDADVAIVGTGPALPWLLQCLALVGVGTRHGRIRLCEADRPVTDDDVADQFLLTSADRGRPIGEMLAERVRRIDAAVDVITGNDPGQSALLVAVPRADELGLLRGSPAVAWGQVMPTAVVVGPQPVEADDRTTVLTAALAAVCGGVLAQIVLAQLGAVVTGPSVLSTWAEERIWIRYPGLGRAAAVSVTESRNPYPALRGVLQRVTSPDIAEGFRIAFDGQPVDPRVTTIVDDDEVVVSLPERATGADGRITVRPLLQAPVPVEPLVWSPIGVVQLGNGRVTAPDPALLPAHLPAAHVVQCGAGALGSWASAVLAAGRFVDLDLLIVDMDESVERHNLNRQVLFVDGDIGQPKAARAAERLAEICPEMRVNALAMPLTPDILADLWGGRTMHMVVDEELQRRREAHHARVEQLLGALKEASAILSCPDNHQTRWVLGVMAEALGIPLINGAAEGFEGRVHVCDPRQDSQCLVCWLGESIAGDAVRHSCTDIIGDAPVPAVVTSAAVIGAVQAATLIATLVGAGEHVSRFHAWEGARSALAGHRGAGRDATECPDHLFALVVEQQGVGVHAVTG
jgi:molybdopterin/thiamine biosynthesis adenylyltransferase